MRIGAALLRVLGLASIGAWLGYRVCSDHYAPLLADAQQQIGQYQTVNAQMRAVVKQQNAAIDDALKLAKQREQAAEDAQRTALGASQAYQQKAAVILASRPASADECAAASAAFDVELEQEREQK
ncbi:hypothetical protein EO087_00335 [Dyella sp. M7H15-1]|nr:hypothetical protein EO087_00335 [Dyella sp. M7H15-1]